MTSARSGRWLGWLAAGLVLLVAGWYVAYRVEAWFIRETPLAGFPTVPVAVRVDVTSPPEYEVTAAALEGAVREVLRERAPWVVVTGGAKNRLHITIELGPMKSDPLGYQGWVRSSFHRARWIPGLGPRPPDWSDEIFVFGKPPRLGSLPRDNVRGAVKVTTRNFIRMALFRDWGLFALGSGY